VPRVRRQVARRRCRDLLTAAGVEIAAGVEVEISQELDRLAAAADK